MRIPVEDASLVNALLASGRLAIVLDGANEGDADDEVRRFANAMHRATILATSQTRSPESFEEYRLPAQVSDYIEPLLRNHLGDDAGARVFKELTPSLVASLRSGYDVRLIGELATPSSALPTSRLALYGAIVAATSLSTRAVEDLAAIAWELWRKSDRLLSESDSLVSSRLREMPELVDERNKVLRFAGRAASYEFRHDQMLAYLAARHLRYSTPSADALVEWWRARALAQRPPGARGVVDVPCRAPG